MLDKLVPWKGLTGIWREMPLPISRALWWEVRFPFWWSRDA
jgi:hypothetical protein